MTTVKELAEKYEMEPKKVRRILRNQGVKRRKSRWQWKDGSKTLAKVENILQQKVK